MASLQAFLASKQRKTLGVLLEAITHLEATLLQSSVEEGIPADTGPPWPRTALYEANRNGPHESACSPDMVIFI